MLTSHPVGGQAIHSSEHSLGLGLGSPQLAGQLGGGMHCGTDGRADGDSDGEGEGTGVGLQSPNSGASLQILGQHRGQRSAGNGMVSQSGLLKSMHKGLRLNGSTSQHFAGHSTVRTLHGVGIAEGALVCVPGETVSSPGTVGLLVGTDTRGTVGAGVDGGRLKLATLSWRIRS